MSTLHTKTITSVETVAHVYIFTILFTCFMHCNMEQEKELRVAWLVPKESHRGVSASTSVNALKVSLKAAEVGNINGYNIR